MTRYAIWNKQDPILTPIGEILTAEQWKERYPIARLDSITVLCAAGEINGAFFGTLGQMVQMYEKEGVDFSACTTSEEKLAAIEAFEDNRDAEVRARAEEEAAAKAANEELSATALASIAASMEYQNMMTLPDEEI